jgi:hypothetical protein
MVAKCFSSLVLVPALLCVAVPGMAQQARTNPYSNLFKPRDLKEVARTQQSATPPAQSRTVCGMKLIPADPSIDPKFVIPRNDDATKYTIRIVPPPACR